MTQILFTVNQQITANLLNQATQGYKFLRRTTYAGSAGSPALGSRIFVTWNSGSGTSALFVRACGGGGPGGDASASSGLFSVAGGGGGGGYAERWILSGFGVQQSVGIGEGGSANTAGGPSSFGTTEMVRAGGGGPGVSVVNNNGASAVFAPGGLGGASTLGDINATGAAGGVGFLLKDGSGAVTVLSGRGGQSAFGGAGGREILVPPPLVSGVFGSNGFVFGGGGSGAAVRLEARSNTGGRGAPGFVIVEEWA